MQREARDNRRAAHDRPRMEIQAPRKNVAMLDVLGDPIDEAPTKSSRSQKRRQNKRWRVLINRVRRARN